MWLRPGMASPVPVLMAVSGAWPGMVTFVWFGLVMFAGVPKGGIICGQSITMWPYSSHSNHLMLGQFLAIWPCSWHWKHLSSSLDIMLTADGGVMVAVSWCTVLSFLTSDIASLSICGPFSHVQVARLWAFFNSLMNILIVAASFVKFHLLASVLNWCTYAAMDSFSHCWISMNHQVYVWISALQSFSLNRSFISSHDLFEVMASVNSVHVKPLDFALASLALLSLVMVCCHQNVSEPVLQLGTVMFIKNWYTWWWHETCWMLPLWSFEYWSVPFRCCFHCEVSHHGTSVKMQNGYLGVEWLLCPNAWGADCCATFVRV